MSMKTTKQIKQQRRLDKVTVWASWIITIVMVTYLIFTQ
jgi:hypothetical protein